MTWNQWITAHIKTCDQCRISMNEDPDTPLCPTAFQKAIELAALAFLARPHASQENGEKQ
jgi:hypothetical protein